MNKGKIVPFILMVVLLLLALPVARGGITGAADGIPPEVEAICEEQGGEIIAWDECGNGIGYSIPGPAGGDPHCNTVDCCACYQTAHIHDLGQVIPVADLIVRYASGFTQGCQDYLTVEVSPDDVNWTWVGGTQTTSESLNGGWRIFTIKWHNIQNFRYVRMTIPNCFIDYSAAYACVAKEVGKPDLVIQEKWEEETKPGYYEVYFVIHNQGNAEAPAGYDAALYVDGSMVDYGQASWPLSPCSIVTLVSNEVKCTGTSDTIKVCADVDDYVDELDETNNCLENVYTCPEEIDIEKMCEEQGGEIIAWDECGNGIGYSIPGPAGGDPHCNTVDCCAWYQTTHVHDLGQVIPLADLILRYAPGLSQGCQDYLTVEVSPDDVNWTWVEEIPTTSESVNGGWQSYTVKLHDIENFRYVKLTIPNCFIDYSAAYACYVPPPEEIPPEIEEMCEEQGGEIIAWDECNNERGYSVPGPADCCATYQTAHIHDLGQVIPLADLIVEYMPGFSDECTDELTIEVSPDDVTWTEVDKIPTTSVDTDPGPGQSWKSYTHKLHDISNFRYVRMTIPNCYNDYSAAYACVVGAPPPTEAVASIEPQSQEVGSGASSIVNIHVDPVGNGVSGGSIRIWFDADVIQVDKVKAGDLLGISPIMAPGYPKIDNVNGVVDIDLARRGSTVPPTLPGNFAVIMFTAKAGAPEGSYALPFPKAELLDENFKNISVTRKAGTIKIVSGYAGPRWDINQDKKVDYIDLAILAAHYGETTTPPYPRWDINEDGEVDYKDLAILGAHYGETY